MPSHAQPAFLSVRLPEATRDRLKAVAAERGETVQSLIGSLVEHFLVEQDRTPPNLGTVVNKLRSHESVLRHRGIANLAVFGSVARGDAGLDSDIDLLADFDPNIRLSIVGLASLQAELSDLLGYKVDLVERTALHPAIKANAEREAVHVL